jgi:hypothetical protein
LPGSKFQDSTCAALLIPNGERKLLRTKLLVGIVNLWANPNAGIFIWEYTSFREFYRKEFEPKL